MCTWRILNELTIPVNTLYAQGQLFVRKKIGILIFGFPTAKFFFAGKR